MRDAGRGGIVLMASDQVAAGKQRDPSSTRATKGGVAQLARVACRSSLGPLGIRVNAVCPATVETPLTDVIATKTWASGRLTATPIGLGPPRRQNDSLGQIAAPEEIASVVYVLKPARLVVYDRRARAG